MLVLSRKVGERIHVGDDITIEIRRIAGNRVTIALGAPRDVRILRGELERAAREFREPDEEHEAHEAHVTECKPCVPLPSTGREAILNGLPASVVH
ncbi:MAG: carbon storage regulator [Pirellulales bacterium]